MHRQPGHRLRRALNLAAAFVLAAAVPAAGSPTEHAQLHVSEAVVGRTQRISLVFNAAPQPCSDKAYRLTGGRWARTLKWYFRASSTPAGLAPSEALRLIRRSFGNIVNARNDCGRSDRVGASASYLGATSSKPSCRTVDGRNVVGFRSLPYDVLARACWWVSDGRIIEADIQINSGFAWATSLSSCRFQPMLGAVVTHEVGHVYGLGHVGELKHGRLTMSTRLDGMCNNQEASLGLGDVLGLERLY